MLGELFGAALAPHRAGALDEAERRYRHILALYPTHADSLHNLGLIALHGGNASSAAELIGKAIKVDNRVAEYHYNIALAYRALNQMEEVATHLQRAIELRSDHALAHLNLGNVLCEQGRLVDATACYQRVLALTPNSAAARFNLANVLSEQGRWDAAIADYKQALTLEPYHAEAHYRLGVALIVQGKINEAIRHLEAAVTIKPDLPGVHVELAKAFGAVEKFDLATEAAIRALELGETPQGHAIFAQHVKFTRVTADHDGHYRKLLLRALSEGWARPRELAKVCVSLIRLDDDINECIARANAAWPARLPPGELLGSPGLAALSQDKLLACLLECDPIPDIGFERLLISVRHAILTVATGDEQAVDEQDLEFYAAVARQCFINEYVYALPEPEAEQARGLQTMLADALRANAPVPPLWPVAVAAYFPLHTISEAQDLLKRSCLLKRSWPDCVNALLVQQVEEPARERQIAATMPALTPIDGDISRAVRQQYEEHPYPRWVKAGPPVKPVIVDEATLDHVAEILIAGCGTGLSLIEVARRLRDARILAIDLSLASLSYAKRMAESFDLTNVEFGQADLLRLGSIGRQFDFIDASGVLHHLADPWQGWRVLLSLLRPGAVMQVGLYSELARQNIVAARALIAARGYRPVAKDIRRCREEIMAADDGSLLKSVTVPPDFFTTGECRDLLFHVQEHRITLPKIKSFLMENDAQFAGFIPGTPIWQGFVARFPEPSALLDLDCWHRFESEAPGTFAAMYQFWVRKKPATPDTAATNTV